MAVEKLILEFIGKDEVSKTTGGITKALGGLGSIAAGAATVGIAAAGAAVVGLGSALVSGVQDAMEAQEVQAQLNAVLESTGGIAGVTTDMANGLADALENTTRFSAEQTLAGENMLLTFTSIGKDVFPDATRTMLDMSQAMGTDATQTAIQLGKALNDPIQGISALSRVGVQFTDEQKAVIQSLVETGDTAGAQRLILEELNREFGGSAEAAGQTLPGKLDILSNKFGAVKETLGGAFIPILTELADLLISGLNSEFFQGILANLSNFITGTVLPGIQNLSNWVKEEVIPRFREFFKDLQESGALQRISEAVHRVAEALGLGTGKVDALGVAFGILDKVLDAVVIGVEIASRIIDGFSRGIEAIRNAIDFVISGWHEFRDAVNDAIDAIPDWLIPGSPTPFEVGLKGISNAMRDVNLSLGGGGAATLPMGGMPGSPIMINLTYAPAVSLADRYEAETVLAPFIANAVRRELERRGV